VDVGGDEKVEALKDMARHAKTHALTNSVDLGHSSLLG
jgi:hypothetical protein